MAHPLTPRHPHVPFRGGAFAVVVLLALTCGCDSSPASLKLNPEERMTFYKMGQQSSIQVSAYTESGKPFTLPLNAAWSSSDESVAKVDTNGMVTSTGSGLAKVTVTSRGISKSLDVEVSILGSVEFAADMAKDYKAAPDERVPIRLVIKDDKGNVMTQHPKVSYDATSGCVDVYQAGTFAPYQKGDCSIIARCGDKEASFRVSVK